MQGLRRFALILVLIALALAGSGALYLRSRSADFDGHSRAVQAIGTVRHLDRLLAEEVLAARFGLLNQYDPVTLTELGLTDAAGDLRARTSAVVPADGALGEALDRLRDSLARQRLAAERFKTENAVLKNSLYYLPTAASEVTEGLGKSSRAPDSAAEDTSLAVHRLVQAALVYNLVGDQSSRAGELDAVADLERRVTERTAELRKAVDALWGEMKLARKIQEALVPSAPSLANCDVAATMRSTEDVGGDYYDIVHAGKSEWILIGDVSGHGVPAGLVMMMCQTAVRTVLRVDPDVAPDTLLAMVNTVLTENIRKLGEDKYMTLTALRRDADGTVLFAGAHQDIHIYRAESDTVETVETSGLWLGIKAHIESTLATRRLHLATGDLLLLLTDGITEATRGGAIFDTAGVRAILDKARGKTAGQVMEEMFTELKTFEVTDDATLLVIRQLDIPAAEEPSLPS